MNYNQPKSNNQLKIIQYCCWQHLQKSKNVKRSSEKNYSRTKSSFFKFNLIHYNEHKSMNNFLDSLASNFRISHFNTSLSIFSVIPSQKTYFLLILQLQYLTIYYIILPSIFADSLSNKSNVFEKKWLSFDRKILR